MAVLHMKVFANLLYVRVSNNTLLLWCICGVLIKNDGKIKNIKVECRFFLF